MIPFLYSDFVALFHSILELVVIPDVLNDCHFGRDIIKLNLDKDLSSKNEDFHIGYSIKALLNDFKKKDSITRDATREYLFSIR